MLLGLLMSLLKDVQNLGHLGGREDTMFTPRGQTVTVATESITKQEA